jgi:hypothetical protein
VAARASAPAAKAGQAQTLAGSIRPPRQAPGIASLLRSLGKAGFFCHHLTAPRDWLRQAWPAHAHGASRGCCGRVFGFNPERLPSIGEQTLQDVAPHGGVAVEVEGRKKVWIDTNEIALDAVIIGVRAVFASVPGVGGASLAAAPLRKSASDATRSPSRPNRLFRNRNARFYGGQKCFAVGTPGLFSPNFASSSGQVLLWQEQSI